MVDRADLDQMARATESKVVAMIEENMAKRGNAITERDVVEMFRRAKEDSAAVAAQAAMQETEKLMKRHIRETRQDPAVGKLAVRPQRARPPPPAAWPTLARPKQCPRPPSRSRLLVHYTYLRPAPAAAVRRCAHALRLAAGSEAL